MADLFVKVLNSSLSASVLVAAVLLLRLLLKKAPKWVMPLLWAIVALRLLLPVSIESVLSLLPSAQPIPADIAYAAAPAVSTGIPAVNHAVNPVIQQNFAPSPGASVNPLQIWLGLGGWIWALGAAAMTAWSLFSCEKLLLRVRGAQTLEPGVLVSGHVDTPFVLGLFRPRIYLPQGLGEEDIFYILAHEKAHIRRRDHWWKPLGFFLLSIHWFNPLMWLSYILLCRDIELACDEKVIRVLGREGRADYSQALLRCTVRQRAVSACPLAFGEVGVKERIKSVLSYRRPLTWVVDLAVMACIVVAICFLTDPPLKLAFMEQTIPVTSAQVLRNEWSRPETAQLEDYPMELLTQCLKGIRKIHPGQPLDAPLLRLNITLENGETIRLDSMMEEFYVHDKHYDTVLTYQGRHYRVEDPDFLYALHSLLSGIPSWDRQLENDWGVSLSVESASATGASVLFQFSGPVPEENLMGGNDYLIQQETDGRWVDVPALSAPNFVKENYNVANIRRHSIDWEWLYGVLPEGHYRIGKQVTWQEDPDTLGYRMAYGEFTLGLTEGLHWGISVSAGEITPEHLVLRYHLDEDAAWQDYYPVVGGTTLETWTGEAWEALDLGYTPQDWTEGKINFESYSDPRNGLFIIWENIGSLPQGTYRISQQVATDPDLAKAAVLTVGTEFTIDLAGWENGMMPLEQLPEFYHPEDAQIDGCLVMTDGMVRSGGEALLQGFLTNSSQHLPAYLRFVTSFLVDGRYQVYVHDLSYDGSQYELRWLENDREHRETYRYLLYGARLDHAEQIGMVQTQMYVLSNDPVLSVSELKPEDRGTQLGVDVDHQVVCAIRTYAADHPEIPEVLSRAKVDIRIGDDWYSYTQMDAGKLESIRELFADSQIITEPKTHSIGAQINLTLTEPNGRTLVIHLDPVNDLCKINGNFCFYGAPDEPCYIEKLWEYMDMDQWPQAVYDAFPDACRK